MKDIELIIKSLRDSDLYIEHIFMRGGCYKFHLFLKSIFPSLKPYIHQDKDHIVSYYDGHFYDIRGRIESKFECLYSPLTTDDVSLVSKWSFSRNYVLQLGECPICEEPLICESDSQLKLSL